MRYDIDFMGKRAICIQAGQACKSIASALWYTYIKTYALHMQVERSYAKISGSSKVCVPDTAQFVLIAVYCIVMLIPRSFHL